MKYGFVIPDGLGVHEIVELAHTAEAAGWDGFFNWDSSYFEQPSPLHDAWLLLAAIAVGTERIRIGALLFALYRRKPWEVARQAVTLDHLSNGRLVMPVGLGAVDAHGDGRFGLPTDRRTRAELLDEHLAILDGLWRGEPFAYDGKHHRLEQVTFLPTPRQKPRIPVWAVGLWPSERSMARALRWDGVIASRRDEQGNGGALTPDDVRAIVSYARERRPAGQPFDVVVEGRDVSGEELRAWAEAGATWWIETMWTPPNDPTTVRRRVEAGPPRT